MTALFWQYLDIQKHQVCSNVVELTEIVSHCTGKATASKTYPHCNVRSICSKMNARNTNSSSQSLSPLSLCHPIYSKRFLIGQVSQQMLLNVRKFRSRHWIITTRSQQWNPQTVWWLSFCHSQSLLMLTLISYSWMECYLHLRKKHWKMM